MKHFKADEVEQFARLIRAMLDREASEFRRVAEEVDVLRPNAPFTDDEIYEWFTAYYELILTDEPITVTSEYSGKLLYKTFDARTNEILKHANVPPTFALIQRINLGLFSLMGKLNRPPTGVASAKSCGSGPTANHRHRWARPKRPGSQAV